MRQHLKDAALAAIARWSNPHLPPLEGKPYILLEQLCPLSAEFPIKHELVSLHHGVYSYQIEAESILIYHARCDLEMAWNA